MDSQVSDSPQKNGSENKKKPSRKEEYEIIDDTIGKGAFGKVYLVKKNQTLFAMKEIEQKKLTKEKKEYQAFVERQLLAKIDYPGIIKLHKCFPEGKFLYYILEYCHGGDLTTFIKIHEEKITEQLRIFYVAELVAIIEYLHNAGITHRDLKPQNVMLSKERHLKLIDFGTAEITKCNIVNEKFKEDIENQKKTKNKSQEQVQTNKDSSDDEDSEQRNPRKRKSTFVGTPYYISPELLQKNICEATSDLWALGCIIYQLYYFQTPFQGGGEFQVFQNIKKAEPKFPINDKISEDAIDLIKKLLIKNPDERLGSRAREGLQFKDLKSHPYFKNINFENIFQQEVPPFK